jgi:hypothetical protein
MARESSDSQGCASWFKWIVGILIALLAAGGGIVALLNYFNPPAPPPVTEPPPPTLTPMVCFLSGKIYDQETNQPLSNVDVSYVRFTQDINDFTHGVRSHLATTNPEGYFEADCSWVEAENFPLRLELHRRQWHYTEQTNEYIELGETRTGIVFYVPDSFYQTPPP